MTISWRTFLDFGQCECGALQALYTQKSLTWKDKVLTSLQNQLLSSCEMLAFKNHGHFSSHELHTACGGKMPFPPACKIEFQFLDS